MLFVCAVTQTTGPSAWTAAWQLRHWGGGNVIGSFLPGFGVVPAPDGVDAILSLILGGALAVMFGLMALSFHRAGRRLLNPAGR